MQSNSTHRSWSACLLALVFVAMWSLKLGHALLGHHEHADRPVCAAAADHAGTHLHDERYSGEDCSICAFVLAVPDAFCLPLLPAPPESLPDGTRTLPYETRIAHAVFGNTCLRGPPAILA